MKEDGKEEGLKKERIEGLKLTKEAEEKKIVKKKLRPELEPTISHLVTALTIRLFVDFFFYYSHGRLKLMTNFKISFCMKNKIEFPLPTRSGGAYIFLGVNPKTLKFSFLLVQGFGHYA